MKNSDLWEAFDLDPGYLPDVRRATRLLAAALEPPVDLRKVRRWAASIERAISRAEERTRAREVASREVPEKYRRRMVGKK